MRYWLVAVALIAAAGCTKKEAAKSETPAPTTPHASPGALKARVTVAPNPRPPARPTLPVGHEIRPGKPAADQAAKILGVSTYPGAKPATGPDAIVRSVKGNQETIQADFKSSDQAGAIHDFYVKKLVKVDQEWINGQAAGVSGRTASGEMVSVMAVADAQKPGQTQVRVIVTRPLKKR